MRSALFLISALLWIGSPVVSEEAEGTYTLVPWPYGAIAWVERIPENGAEFAGLLTESVEHAFQFWGYESPVPPETWEHPWQVSTRIPTDGRLPQIVLTDPPSGDDWRLEPLTWEGEQIYPIIVIVFPDRQSFHNAIGRELPAYFFCSHGPVTNVELWIRPLMRKPRSMLCPIDASQATLVKEFAHWFAYERNVWLFRTPPYIYEGISEVTAAAFPDDSEGAKIDVAEWASRNCLSMCVSSFALTEAVGESFVGFLIDELGHEGFLDSLRLWAVDAYGMRAKYQGPWRISIGLPDDCP